MAKRCLVSASLSIYTPFAPGKPEGADFVLIHRLDGESGIGTM
jgi:hypothetical protein